MDPAAEARRQISAAYSTYANRASIDTVSAESSRGRLLGRPRLGNRSPEVLEAVERPRHRPLRQQNADGSTRRVDVCRRAAAAGPTPAARRHPPLNGFDIHSRTEPP